MCIGWEKFLWKSWERVNTIRRKIGYNKMKISRAKTEDLNFHETSLFNNSIECNPNQSLEAFPGEKRWTVETHPLLLRILMRITFIESRKFLQHYVSTQPPKKKRAFFPYIVFLHSYLPLLPDPHHYCSHLCTIPPPWNMFYFPFLERYMYLT